MRAETQRRKNKDSEPLMQQAEDNKYRSTMQLPMFLKRPGVKKFVVVVIVFFLIWKLYQMFAYSGTPTELPPQHKVGKKTEWEYEHNRQGLTEKSLKEVLDTIEEGEKIKINRKLSPEEMSTIESFNGRSLKVDKPYQSTGSLTFKGGKFYLRSKPLQILSGAMHYFRVMPEYWQDRMKKMKACGLNTLETYVPWNLHEESPGNFNFEGILDIRKYIQLANQEGLYVILRPGPYICSEWDFGGMPGWLLKDPNMKVRSNYQGYKDAVERYFKKLIPLVADLQYSQGGPLIAVQIENEFGSYSIEVAHLMFIKQLLIDNGIQELLFVSDGIVKKKTGFEVAPFLDQALPTVNFMKFPLGKVLVDQVRSASPDFPILVMEFWSGWFDHWGKPHAFSLAQNLGWDLQNILEEGGSVNFYMFHGGTNFGFTAGANWFNDTGYKSDVTSYDYIAPLSEAGDITPKYEIIRAILKKFVLEPEGIFDLPEIPKNSPKGNYGEVMIDKYMLLEDMITPIKAVASKKPLPMEMLNIHDGYGQNFGFILYRAIVHKGKKVKFTAPIRDRAMVLLNGHEVGVFSWHSKVWEVDLPETKMSDENILDVLVENHGRVNYVHQGFNRFNEERKGVSGEVLMDGKMVENWKIYPLEFKEPYVTSISKSHQWKTFANWPGNVVSLYQGRLIINATPRDTFINMKGWTKGNVFINGFNLGRYWKEGPQKTLFVPAPILQTGTNTVVIFEIHKPAHAVTFQNIHEIS